MHPLSQAPNPDTVTKGNLEAAFEVESLSPAELLEQPVTGDGKVLISSEQLKHMSTLLDSPVSCSPTYICSVYPVKL